MQMSEHFSWFNMKVLFLDNICGKSVIPPILISERSKRIVGGLEAVANSWPWHAAIQRSGEFLN